jgi:hypothetical protein
MLKGQGTHAKVHLGPVQLSARELGTAVSMKAAEKSRNVCAGFLPCSSTQLKAKGNVPRSIADTTCDGTPIESSGKCFTIFSEADAMSSICYD